MRIFRTLAIAASTLVPACSHEGSRAIEHVRPTPALTGTATATIQPSARLQNILQTGVPEKSARCVAIYQDTRGRVQCAQNAIYELGIEPQPLP